MNVAQKLEERPRMPVATRAENIEGLVDDALANLAAASGAFAFADGAYASSQRGNADSVDRENFNVAVSRVAASLRCISTEVEELKGEETPPSGTQASTVASRDSSDKPGPNSEDRFSTYIESVIECGIECTRDQLHVMFDAVLKLQLLVGGAHKSSSLDESMPIVAAAQGAFGEGCRALIGLEIDLRSEAQAYRKLAGKIAAAPDDSAAEE